MDKIYELVASPLTGRALVLAAVLFPFVAALIVWCFTVRARRVALTLAFVQLGLTVTVGTLGLMYLKARQAQTGTATVGDTKFAPTLVPGDTGGRHGEANQTGWTLMSLAESRSIAARSGPDVQFYVGIDGMNMWLLLLSGVMLIPAILASWDSVTEKPGAFFALLFLMQGAAIGAFLSFDVILFYAFFELTLIPAFFLIGGWGTGSGRRDAARKFFLYTLAGSLLTLVGVIGVVVTNPHPDTGLITFSLPELVGIVQARLGEAHKEALAGNPAKLDALHATQAWLFFAMMAGFLVKVPIWPFHTWLPSAYGEAPVGVTVLLSALLAKLGTFGILRFVLTLTPDAAVMYGLPIIGPLAAFGIVYAALCAYDQKDVKLTIAYSSVSHLGFLVLALFAFNAEGLSGALLHMVNHGLTTGALFALLAFLLDRYGTTQAARYGGLQERFPKFSKLAFVLLLASVGLPGLNNFVSEMLMLAGLFDARNPDVSGLWPAVVAAAGIFLSAWYTLTMMQKVFFNPVREPQPLDAAVPPTDLNRRELFAYGSLAAVCLVLGLYPQPVLNAMRPEVRTMSNISEAARARVRHAPLPAELIPPPPKPAVDPNAKAPQPKKGPNPKKGPQPKKAPNANPKLGGAEEE